MRDPQPILGSGFFYALIGGFFLAIFAMGIVGLGECARDGSSESQACQAAQQRIGLFYPVFYLAISGFAVFRHRRGLEGAGGLAIFAGPLAAIGVMLVNAFAR